eukprot:COSAG01_NODE_3698_length_5784_cov_5.069129_2_plen_184_part_00
MLCTRRESCARRSKPAKAAPKPAGTASRVAPPPTAVAAAAEAAEPCHAMPRCFNDAPCPPFTSHGASTRKLFGAAMPPQSRSNAPAVSNGKRWRRRYVSVSTPPPLPSTRPGVAAHGHPAHLRSRARPGRACPPAPLCSGQRARRVRKLRSLEQGYGWRQRVGCWRRLSVERGDCQLSGAIVS